MGLLTLLRDRNKALTFKKVVYCTCEPVRLREGRDGGRAGTTFVSSCVRGGKVRTAIVASHNLVLLSREQVLYQPT